MMTHPLRKVTHKTLCHPREALPLHQGTATLPPSTHTDPGRALMGTTGIQEERRKEQKRKEVEHHQHTLAQQNL